MNYVDEIITISIALAWVLIGYITIILSHNDDKIEWYKSYKEHYKNDERDRLALLLGIVLGPITIIFLYNAYEGEKLKNKVLFYNKKRIEKKYK
jgi:hypothetical protein